MRGPYRPVSAPKDVEAIGLRFGRRVRKLREDRGWTQLSMAIALGIDRSYLSDLERGVSSISLPMLEVLALGLDQANVSELLKDV